MNEYQRRLPLVLLFTLTLLFVSCGGETGDTCLPNCSNKVCGDNGCSGSCGECADNLSCTVDRCVQGKCTFQVDPNYCVILDSCVPSGTEQPENSCRKCVPSLDNHAWTAAEDGAQCALGAICYQGECCTAQQNCTDKECGSDGCGGSCGECGEWEECVSGQCEPVDCDPKCEGKDCGDDGCGGECGTCPGGYECEEGACVCQPLCAGKECGPDGCGGDCGLCQGVNVVCQQGHCSCASVECNGVCCGPDQVCVGDEYCCKPECDNRECGDDACGSICGTCTGDNVSCIDGQCVCPGMVCPDGCCQPAEICDLAGKCCLPQCSGKECGPDQCGSLCGLCDPGQLCLTGICPPPGDVCLDGNDEDWDGCTGGQLSEFQVNTWTENWQYNPSVVALNGGTFVVTWDSRLQDATGEGVFGQLVGSQGNFLGSEFRVNTHMVENQLDNASAAFDDGRFVVAWESYEQDGNGKGIYFQRYSTDGSKAGLETQVNTATVGDQMRPDVTPFSDGGFVVVWDGMSINNIGGVIWDDVYGQLYDAAGAPVGSSFLVNTTTANVQAYSKVERLSDDGFVVAWQSVGQDGYLDGVYFQRFDSEGTPQGSETQVNEYVFGSQRYPEVLGLHDGRFLILWESVDQDGDGSGVYGRYFAADGTAEVAEFRLSATTSDDQEGPKAALFTDGRVVMVWESQGQDGSMGTIIAQMFDSDGARVGDELVMNEFTASNQQTPDVAVLDDESFVVVWRSFAQEEVDNDSYGVFGRRFTTDGDPIYH